MAIDGGDPHRDEDVDEREPGRPRRAGGGATPSPTIRPRRPDPRPPTRSSPVRPKAAPCAARRLSLPHGTAGGPVTTSRGKMSATGRKRRSTGGTANRHATGSAARAGGDGRRARRAGGRRGRPEPVEARAGPTGTTRAGPRGSPSRPARERTVTTDDGAELVVYVAGPAKGPTVVLPHCWTGTKEIWAPVARRLVAAGHRVVLYDQRGHGRLDARVGTDGRRSARARTSSRCSTRSSGDDLVLAGHSMGGMTIQALATNHPEVVRDRVRGRRARRHGHAVHALRGAPHPCGRHPRGGRRSGLGRHRPDRAAARPAARVGQLAHRSHVQATYDAFVATPGRGPRRLPRGDDADGLPRRAGRASASPPRSWWGRTTGSPRWSRARELQAGISGSELIVLPGPRPHAPAGGARRGRRRHREAHPRRRLTTTHHDPSTSRTWGADVDGSVRGRRAPR